MPTAVPTASPAQTAAELARLRDALIGEQHWILFAMGCDLPALRILAREARLPAGCGAFGGVAAWLDHGRRRADFGFLAIPKGSLGRNRLDTLLAGVGCDAGAAAGDGDVLLLGDAGAALPPLVLSLQDGEVCPHDLSGPAA